MNLIIPFMKKNSIVLGAILICASIHCIAQKSYVTLGTGLNNYNGLIGLGLDLRLADQASLRMGAGLGTWGTKVGAGFVLNADTSGDWKFAIGYSSCSGLKDFKTELEVKGGTKKIVTMDLYRVGTFNLSAIRSWKMKNDNRFNLEFGYAIATGGSTFYKVKDGSTLTENTKKVMDILRPGGFVFALSYNFAIN